MSLSLSLCGRWPLGAERRVARVRARLPAAAVAPAPARARAEGEHRHAASSANLNLSVDPTRDQSARASNLLCVRFLLYEYELLHADSFDYSSNVR